MSVFRIEIPAQMSEEQAAALNECVNRINDLSLEEIKVIASELNVSESCAGDVWYLRQRSRWTTELESELIRLHRAGTPPNLMEFGH